MALPMASSSTVSLNGFVRNSTAPAFMACTVIGTSPCPVMKMIGMSVRSASCFCNSSPLRPGSDTSSTRQLGTVGRGWDRKSCADTNVWARHPAALMSSSNDSRTETSSSTTKTTEVTFGMATTSIAQAAVREVTVYARAYDVPVKSAILPHPKRGVQRVEERRLAERFEQALH